jgi:hypothetical protein
VATYLETPSLPQTVRMFSVFHIRALLNELKSEYYVSCTNANCRCYTQKPSTNVPRCLNIDNVYEEPATCIFRTEVAHSIFGVEEPQFSPEYGASSSVRNFSAYSSKYTDSRDYMAVILMVFVRMSVCRYVVESLTVNSTI